jgi:hypothetical protein
MNNERITNLKGQKVMNKEVIKFRNGMFFSSSRNCGETYMEVIVRKILGLFKSSTKDNDAITTDSERVEIKTSKVLIKKKEAPSFTETVMLEDDNNGPGLINRLIKFMDCYDVIYDSNIQNIKRHKFDILIYVMLFEDCIKIFKSKSEDISDIPGWSGRHGGEDKVGKNGQFGIKKHRIKWHLDKTLIHTLTWDEIYEMSKDIIRSKGKKNHWVYKGEEKDSE